ncbi:hypothetical protein KKG72_05595 [bacterium]|nr:hypothetical protein [bacterium]MBU1993574.1 hypothetical protein [bacterium]
MILQTIQKQKLLSGPYSDDALKLARALYNTYVKNDEEPFMKINIKNILTLLKLQADDKALRYIRKLLEELNEPLRVVNFQFMQKKYPIRFVVFCKYSIHDEVLELELSEEFLHAQNEYMLEKFL